MNKPFSLYAMIDDNPLIYSDFSGRSISKILAEQALRFPQFRFAIVRKTPNRARVRVSLRTRQHDSIYMDIWKQDVKDTD